MRRELYILIISIGICSYANAQKIDGTWEETYWSPMTSYYYFNSLDSTFKYYYHDDTHGSFGKGHFIIKKNRLIFDYDSIICNIPKVELLDNDLINDSTYIAFFQYWGFPKQIDIISNGKRIYSNQTNSSDSIIEDYLFIKVPQKLDSVEFEIYDRFGHINDLIAKFSIRLYNKPFCNVYYYPSKCWYDFIKPSHREIKYKWINNDFFEIRGKYKYGFKRKK